MKNIAAYARFLAEELMEVILVVSVVRTTNNFAGLLRRRAAGLQLVRLGHKWFEQGVTEEVDRLLIHEFGHQYSAATISPRSTMRRYAAWGQAQEAGPGEARSPTPV